MRLPDVRPRLEPPQGAVLCHGVQAGGVHRRGGSGQGSRRLRQDVWTAAVVRLSAGDVTVWILLEKDLFAEGQGRKLRGRLLIRSLGR